MITFLFPEIIPYEKDKNEESDSEQIFHILARKV